MMGLKPCGGTQLACARPQACRSLQCWMTLAVTLAMAIAAALAVLETTGIAETGRNRMRTKYVTSKTHTNPAKTLEPGPSWAKTNATVPVSSYLRKILRTRSDLSCRLQANRGKVHVPALVLVDPSASLPTNLNWCHFLNDWVLPMFALRLSVLSLASSSGSAVSAVLMMQSGTSGGTVQAVNCGSFLQTAAFRGKVTGQMHEQGFVNAQQIISAALDCNELRAFDTRNASEFCSENAYELTSFPEWINAWTSHMNGNYNWHKHRFVANPAKVGRGQHAIAVAYRRLSLHVRKYFTTPQASTDSAAPASVMFANRRGSRNVMNMEAVESFVAERLGRHNVRRGVYFFESKSVPQAAQDLAHVRIMVSPHGAQLSNMLFLPRGASVIELVPFRCQRLRIIFESMAGFLGLRYYAWQPTVASMVPQAHLYDKDADKHAFQARDADKEQCQPRLMNLMFEANPAEVLDLIRLAMLDGED